MKGNAVKIRIAAITSTAIAAALIAGITLTSAGTPHRPAIASTQSGALAPKPAIRLAAAPSSPAPSQAASPAATGTVPASPVQITSTSTRLPVPVIDTITTYAAPGNSGCAGPGACATITWQPVSGATHYRYVLSVVNPDGSLTEVQHGRATTTSVSLTGLTANARYGFKIAARPGGEFTLEYPVWPETCALPQPYGPENVVAARTAVWDGQSWAGWVSANTPGEFSTSLQWTFDCESDSQSDLLAVEYINADNFTAPTLAGTPIWHLAAP